MRSGSLVLTRPRFFRIASDCGRGGAEFGLLEVSHASEDWLDEHSEPRVVALGAALMTDVLIAHAAAPRGERYSHCLPDGTPAAAFVSTARRAAWKSLAFAFRTAPRGGR